MNPIQYEFDFFMTNGRTNKMYALDKSGKLRVFQLEIRDNVIVTKTGTLEGKLIENKTVVKSTKSKGTLGEQAILQAKAKISDKLDEGYKTAQMVMSAAKHRFSQEQIDRLNGIRTSDPKRYPAALWRTAGIKWNTTANWEPLPMLAHPIKENEYEGIIGLQRKYDGVRGLIRYVAAGDRRGVTIMSRGGKYYHFPHLEKQISILGAAICNKYGLSSVLFDGEIYKHGMPLADISGAARTQNKSLFAEEEFSWLEYHIYDVPFLFEARMEDRMVFLSKLTEVVKATPNIKIVETIPVAGLPESAKRSLIKTLHDRWVSEGYEGAIARVGGYSYEFGFRSRSLLKIKEFLEEDYIIVDTETNPEVGVSSFTFVLSDPKTGSIFKARSLGSHDYWSKLLANPPLGRRVTLRFLNYSVNGIPEKGVVKVIRDYE